MDHAWKSGGFPGMTYGCSDSGWITTDLFKSWLSDHFLKHAVREQPLLLLLDGHRTHYQPEVIRYAKRNKVLIIFLPPLTTHEAQPLDCFTTQDPIEQLFSFRPTLVKLSQNSTLSVYLLIPGQKLLLHQISYQAFEALRYILQCFCYPCK